MKKLVHQQPTKKIDWDYIMTWPNGVIFTFSKNNLITPDNRSSVLIFSAWILSNSLSNLDGVNLFKIPRTVFSISCYNIVLVRITMSSHSWTCKFTSVLALSGFSFSSLDFEACLGFQTLGSSGRSGLTNGSLTPNLISLLWGGCCWPIPWSRLPCWLFLLGRP